MTRTLRAALIPHAPMLVTAGFEHLFAPLRLALEDLKRELAQRRPALLIASSSGHLSLGPFRLVSARLFQGTLGGAAIARRDYAIPGIDADLARSLTRRLRMAGIDAEHEDGAALDSASAISLGLVLPNGGVPLLPIAVPAGPLRVAFRFGSVLADLLSEHELDAFWLACGSLSHRVSKDAETLTEETEAFDREILSLVSAGEIDAVLDLPPRRLARAAADAGLAHLVPLLGFLGEGYRAEVLAYGGIFGAGSPIVAFRGGERRTGEFVPAMSSDRAES